MINYYQNCILGHISEITNDHDACYIDGIFIHGQSHQFIYASMLAVDGFEVRYHSQIEMKENSSGGGRKEGWKDDGGGREGSASVENQQIYEEVEIYV